LTSAALNLEEYRKMVVGASYYFHREKEAINSLNVFPVPDGDTGSNMSMTLDAAARGALEYPGESVGELAEKVASYALMGARGNSGVILSQLLRGISRGVVRKDEVVSNDLSKAFQYGVVYAYKAVSRPVEGTILTVARDIARGTRGAVRQGADIFGILETAVDRGEKSLLRTMDLLPTLKEAGVVDAGGKGLVVFLRGCLYALQSRLEEILNEEESLSTSDDLAETSNISLEENFDLDHPYCTELIIKGREDSFEGLSQKLNSLGESLLVVDDDKLCKIHIHTGSPDLVLQECLGYGSLHDIKIENMLDQYKENQEKTESSGEGITAIPSRHKNEAKDAGIISVSFGEGINEIFFGLGVDEIVYGGQTMNPKVEDLLEAIQKSFYDRLLILPNNKNIQLVAEQASKLASKEVEVIKTSTIPEGIAALLSFNSSLDYQSNVSLMQENIKQVKSGEVTYAIRDTYLEGQRIKKGSCLGLYAGEICSWGDDPVITALELVKNMIGKEDELVTVLYGEGIVSEKSQSLKEALEDAFPLIEVELKYGGQPVYYFIVSVE